MTPLLAQRELSWDELAVTARLDADGVLDVAERHTMVFTGDWNGGELFNVRPHQKLEFLGMERLDATGTPQALRETSKAPDNVDEFAFANRRTLRWRSRLPSDPPFTNTRLTYVLHYKLSGILRKDAEQYQLAHDFAFPDRVGSIARFSLNLSVDSGWQPLTDMRQRYTAGPLPPGQSFVLTIPLRYVGAGAPIAIDNRVAIVGSVAAILGAFVLGVLAFFMRDRALGRFASSSKRNSGNPTPRCATAGTPGCAPRAWDGRSTDGRHASDASRRERRGGTEARSTRPASPRPRARRLTRTAPGPAAADDRAVRAAARHGRPRRHGWPPRSASPGARRAAPAAMEYRATADRRRAGAVEEAGSTRVAILSRI